MTISQPKLVDEEDIPEMSLPTQHERKKNMYVDNDRLTSEMLKWRSAIEAAQAEGKERPRMPEYVGLSVMLIARNISKKPCYSGYSWIEEMISDGIEACCMYLHNYNPNAQTRAGKPNPFGYISITVERAFKHRIESENRQIYYKNKSFELMGGADAFEGEDPEAIGGEGSNQMMADMINRVYEYENHQADRAAKEREKVLVKTATTLTLFDAFGDDQDE